MRKTPLIAGQYYHVYNRGVNFEQIFFIQENWQYFLRRLRRFFDPSNVEMVAYCLMPNHYHLLVYLKTNDFSRKVMHPFSISYTKAINKQQGRVGPLFQGPFQAKQVDQDAYLLHLTRYIHLNPVQDGLVTNPVEWEYSSYRNYIGLRKDAIVHADIILEQFTIPKEYADFVCSELEPEAALSDDVLFD
jgi:REP element-mobilizing transposase RayT